MRLIWLITLASVVARVSARTCDAISRGPIRNGGCVSCSEVIKVKNKLVPTNWTQDPDRCYPREAAGRTNGWLPVADGKTGCCYTSLAVNAAGNCFDEGGDDDRDDDDRLIELNWYCGCVSGPVCDPWWRTKSFDGLVVSVGLMLMAIAYLAFRSRKKRRHAGRFKSETPFVAAADTTRHPLLGDFASHSYLIDQDDVVIERDGLIGRGGEGFVMRGKFNGDAVAVKVVTMGMTDSERDTMVSLATKEVKLLQQLHHPNIVQLFGMTLKVSSLDTKIMLVMECCMCSLKQHVTDATKRITPIEVLGFLLDISRGMLHLHANDLIHRDLKVQYTL